MTIRDYTQHGPGCRTLTTRTASMPRQRAACSCGLDEALRRVEELERIETASREWLAAWDAESSCETDERRERALVEVRAALAADQGSEE